MIRIHAFPILVFQVGDDEARGSRKLLCFIPTAKLCATTCMDSTTNDKTPLVTYHGSNPAAKYFCMMSDQTLLMLCDDSFLRYMTLSFSERCHSLIPRGFPPFTSKIDVCFPDLPLTTFFIMLLLNLFSFTVSLDPSY